MGADSLTVMELEMSDGSVVPTHTHPTEEAMVVMEGELEALVGDTVENVGPGRTVLAPAGVKHGLTNRSGASSRVMAIFPTSKVVRDFRGLDSRYKGQLMLTPEQLAHFKRLRLRRAQEPLLPG